MYSKYYILTFILFISCNADPNDWLERYSSSKGEMEKLEKKMQADYENATASLSLKKASLEDSLKSVKAVYENELNGYKVAIRETEKQFLKQLRKAKEDHFSKYGHRVEHAASLDKAIEDLRNEKDRKLSLLNNKIKEAENKLINDPDYTRILSELKIIETRIEETKRLTESKYKASLDSLSDKIETLKDEEKKIIERMNTKERNDFVNRIDSIEKKPCRL